MKKSEIIKALEIVKPGLASKEVIEQSTSFAFMDGRVVTYNDEISVSHPVEGLEITGAIQATEFYMLLKKLKDEEIDISITDTEILLTSGKSKAGLTLQAEIKLPLAEIGTLTKWKAIPEGFLVALSMAMYSCGHDSSKPVLTCVHVNKAGFIEGSDGFRILRHQLEDEMPVKTFLIPAGSANEVGKMNPTKVTTSEGWIHFKNEAETILSCRTFEDSFPDTTKFLEVEGDAIPFPATINEILDRALVFNSSCAVLDQEVNVELFKRKIKISSHSDTGWFEEEANVKYAGEGASFIISPQLLKSILSKTQQAVYNGKLLKFEGEKWEFVTLLKA